MAKIARGSVPASALYDGCWVWCRSVASGDPLALLGGDPDKMPRSKLIQAATAGQDAARQLIHKCNLLQSRLNVASSAEKERQAATQKLKAMKALAAELREALDKSKSELRRATRKLRLHQARASSLGIQIDDSDLDMEARMAKHVASRKSTVTAATAPITAGKDESSRRKRRNAPAPHVATSSSSISSSSASASASAAAQQSHAGLSRSVDVSGAAGKIRLGSPSRKSGGADDSGEESGDEEYLVRAAGLRPSLQAQFEALTQAPPSVADDSIASPGRSSPVPDVDAVSTQMENVMAELLASQLPPQQSGAPAVVARGAVVAAPSQHAFLYSLDDDDDGADGDGTNWPPARPVVAAPEPASLEPKRARPDFQPLMDSGPALEMANVGDVDVVTRGHSVDGGSADNGAAKPTAARSGGDQAQEVHKRARLAVIAAAAAATGAAMAPPPSRAIPRTVWHSRSQWLHDASALTGTDSKVADDHSCAPLLGQSSRTRRDVGRVPLRVPKAQFGLAGNANAAAAGTAAGTAAGGRQRKLVAPILARQVRPAAQGRAFISSPWGAEEDAAIDELAPIKLEDVTQAPLLSTDPGRDELVASEQDSEALRALAGLSRRRRQQQLQLQGRMVRATDGTGAPVYLRRGTTVGSRTAISGGARMVAASTGRERPRVQTSLHSFSGSMQQQSVPIAPVSSNAAVSKRQTSSTTSGSTRRLVL